MPKRAENPLKSGYCPILNVPLVLGLEEASYYQSLTGVLRCMIEIGQINTNTKVSLLSSHSAMLRQRHLEVALHIMGYLKLRHNSSLAFNPSHPNLEHSNFWECDWTDFYEGAVEAIPPNAPLMQGKEVELCMFIDSNHAGNKLTKKS